MSESRGPSTDAGRTRHSPMRSGSDETTQQRTDERVLRDPEQELRALFDVLGEGVAVYDREGRLVDLNPEAERHLGRPREALLGGRAGERPLRDTEGNEMPLERFPVQQCVRTGQPAAGVVVFRRDGEDHWFEVNARPLLDEQDGSVRTVVASYRDVTEPRRTLQRLQKAEERYRLLVEQLPLVVYVDAPDERCTNLYTSPATREMFGIEPQEWADPGMLERILHPDDRERVFGEVRRQLADGGTFEQEYRYVLADGRVVWVRDVSVVLRDDDGRPVAVQGYLRDITEQRRLAAAAERVARRYEQLVTRSSDIISLFDADGRWLYVTGAVEGILGVQPKELVGKRSRDFLAADDAAVVADAFAAALRSPGEVVGYEVRVEAGGGRTLWLEGNLVNRLDDPDVEAIVGTSRDVTERHLAATAIRAERDRFVRLADSIDEVFWMASLDRVTYVNPAFERLWGQSAEELLTDPGRLFASIHPDDREAFAAFFEAQRQGQQDEIEYRIVRPDGDVRWVWDRAHPIVDDEGVVVGVTGVAADITERRTLLDQQERAAERYRDLSESLRELVERVETMQAEESERIARELHDELGQAITAVKFDLQWLLKRQPDAATVERVRALLEITDGTLDTVRRMCAELRPSSLDVGLAATIEAESARFARRYGLRCSTRVSDEVQTAPDKVTLEAYRIFQEALTNVARHALASAVSVTYARSAMHLQLTVDDDGVGIPDDVSHGLGLLGMRERAARIGGTLVISRLPSGGTRVNLEVPVPGV